MRYYRMDSDLYRWPAWDVIWASVGKENERDFRFAFELYGRLYSMLCEQYKPDHPKRDLKISVPALAGHMRAREPRVERFLAILSQVFKFEIHPDESDPALRRIVYPNLLRKQAPGSARWRDKKDGKEGAC